MMKDPSTIISFTKEAFENLHQDEIRLRRELEEVKERLKVAREMGDLSENGAYRYAKFEISSISRQLRQVQYQLHNGKVVAKKDHYSQVEFGCTVTLRQNEKDLSFLIVSEHESDPKSGKISMESPLGKALLGKKIGDEILVEAPVGTSRFTLLNIS